MINNFKNLLGTLYNYIPQITVINIIEIVILTYIVYKVLDWILEKSAWSLFRGAFFIVVFIAFAYFLKFNVILWIFEKMIPIVAVIIVIVFQTEIKKAIERIGSYNYGFKFLSLRKGNNDREFLNLKEIVKACFIMAKNKTGALIVIEKKDELNGIENTGIMLNANVTKELIVNIFEKNTPLHDGAVVISNNHITAATCYLPLSENSAISKELGTRHRAALGISEISDALTIVVSEETGRVSIAIDGKIKVIHDEDGLLSEISLYLSIGDVKNINKNTISILKGWMKNG